VRSVHARIGNAFEHRGEEIAMLLTFWAPGRSGLLENAVAPEPANDVRLLYDCLWEETYCVRREAGVVPRNS